MTSCLRYCNVGFYICYKYCLVDNMLCVRVVKSISKCGEIGRARGYESCLRPSAVHGDALRCEMTIIVFTLFGCVVLNKKLYCAAILHV